MNDGQYTNLRNYLEEIASTNKQLLEAQKRNNELLNEVRLATNRTDERVKDIAKEVFTDMLVGIANEPSATMASKSTVPDAIGPVTVETVEIVDDVPTVTRTTTVPRTTTETGEVKSANLQTATKRRVPKPDVNWNS